jgi:pimeloyl-ACP methyl ester carboxylesterase
VRAIGDALGLDRFGLWGFSGGGPFVLGAAAGLGERVTGAVVLGSPAPGLYELDPAEEYETERERMLAETPADWLARLQPRHAAFAEFAIETLNIALAESAEGWLEDDAAMAGDWGFDLAAVRAPVRIRHGRGDTAVPVERGELLASRVPRAELLVADEDGHQDVHFRYMDEDFAWLAAHASATA